MLALRRIALTAALAALGLPAHAASSQAGPVGLWRTISDVDGKPTAVVEIRETAGEFTGVVRELLAESDTAATCDKCSGARRGQRVIGMEILWGLHADGDEWSGGSILDPDNGRIYKAKMRLEDGGKKLIVRGFIGFALLGRSQTWVRQER